MAHVAIIGSGYVGLCTGIALAERGHTVRVVDVDPVKVEQVGSAQAPFHEPGLADALRSVVDSGHLSATTDVAAAVGAASVTFLCVGTPQGADGSADLSFVEQAARDVGAVLADHPGRPEHVLVVKSTVPPGTTARLVATTLHEAVGEAVAVAMNPEFLREGAALADAREPDRIVIGADDQDAAARVWALYEHDDCPKLTVDPTTAETIKYAANAFLATKVGLTNEVANVCERLGVDWNDVAHGIGLDPRIGSLFLRAGAGFGGSCFPKDVSALAKVARDVGRPSGILAAVLEGNDRQPLVAVEMLRELVGGDLAGKRIALLGLAFKEGTDDVRESRALPILRALEEAGAAVVCHDPEAHATFSRLAPKATVVESVDRALDGADGCIVQTAWPEYGAIPAATFSARMASPNVVDGRRALDAGALEAAGVRYRAIGLGRRPGQARDDRADPPHNNG